MSGITAYAVHVSEVEALLDSVQPYGVLSIANETQDTLYFQLRFSENEQWGSFTVEPGTKRTFWSTERMDPEVKFDYSFEPGYQLQEYWLEYNIYWSGEGAEQDLEQNARAYYFDYTEQGVDLYEYE